MLWLRELTSQYGSLNMMLCCLMPCLGIRSSCAPTLFLWPCNHALHSLPNFMISNATTCMGAILFSISLLKELQVCQFHNRHEWQWVKRWEWIAIFHELHLIKKCNLLTPQHIWFVWCNLPCFQCQSIFC